MQIICIYIYVYVCIEREMYTHYIYIYIYMYIHQGEPGQLHAAGAARGRRGGLPRGLGRRVLRLRQQRGEAPLQYDMIYYNII